MHEPTDIAASTSKVEITWAISSGIIVGLAALSWLVFSYGYVEDDAFIHLEFARSVAEGRGFSFNSEIVNGDTSPLWVIALAGVHSLGFGWIAAAKFLSGIGVLIALSGVWRIAAEIPCTAPRNLYLAPAALLVTGLNPYFVHWSFSGMESVTALGVSLWAIWAVFLETMPSWRRLLLGAILLSIAPLIRPELVILSSIAGIVLLYRAWRSPPSTVNRVVAVAVLAIIMLVPIALWSAYSLESFGSIIPNTNAAKRGGGLLQVSTKLASVYLVGFAGTIALLPFVAKRLLKPGVPPAIWVLLLWPAACAVFYIADHTAVQTRYCLLSMPSMTIAVLWLLNEVARPAWARSVVAAVTIVELAILSAIVIPHVSNKVQLVKTVSATSNFIRNTLPPDAPVAVYSIGQLTFESRHPIIDLGGITRRGVLPFLGDLPATMRWAKSQGAKYYIGGESPEPAAVRIFAYPMPFVGWSFNRSNYRMISETGIYRLP